MDNSEQAEQVKKEMLLLAKRYYELKFCNKPFVPGVSKVDPSGKLFDERELQNGIEAVLDGWWTEGRFAKEFERKFGDYLGAKHVMLTNSGSSASLLAMFSLTSPELGIRGIKPGDEVIGVAAAFPTTVSPIVQAGCVPVFVDIDPLETGRYNIDASKLESAVSDKTRAIFIAHTLGNPFDVDKVREVADKYNLWVIEDSCDALGSKYKGRKTGNLGDIATFSFYPAHHITMGEGGAVVTNNDGLKKIINSFRNWGRHCWCEPGKDDSCGKRYNWQIGKMPKGYDHKNTYNHLGFNLKSTDMQAAIGLAQLEKLDDFTAKRKDNFDYLKTNLAAYEDSLILPSALPEAEPSWFGFLLSVRDNAGFTREELVDYLTQRKVNSRALFAGNLTRHPCLEGVNYRISGDLENSDRSMDSTFWIGVQPNMTPEMREYTVKQFDEFFARKK